MLKTDVLHSFSKTEADTDTSRDHTEFLKIKNVTSLHGWNQNAGTKL